MATVDLGEGILRAALGALRPFARELVARGVPFGQFERALRRVYVDVAEAEHGPDASDSQISLRTGLNRKEVRRLRSEATSRGESKAFTRSRAAGLVSLWLQHPEATDARGAPLAIPYRAKGEPSFTELAKATTTDVSPRSLLDTMIRAGAVERRPDGKIALVADAFVPRQSPAELISMLAEDPAELIETMIRNVLRDGDRRVQRKVAYDNVGSDGLEALQQRLRSEAERFLRRIDRLMARFDRDRNPKAAGGEPRYVGLGIYYFERHDRSLASDSKSDLKRGGGNAKARGARRRAAPRGVRARRRT